jgi:methionyl-tRNA formyltransferase
MQRRIIILTARREAPLLQQFLLEQNPFLSVGIAHNLSSLTAAINRFDGNVRIISFLAGTIVPAALLSQLRITPYNIHPGSPEYPGSHPESFAIWEDAETFGVTAHEMTARVDAGPIVAVCRFPASPTSERMELADLTYAHAVNVFSLVGAYCADTDESMPPMEEEQWAPRKRTNKQFQALCQMPAGASSDMAAKLWRACGDDLVSYAAAAQA